MTDREQELQLITAQLQLLRAEAIEMQKAMHQVMFAFLTVTAVIGGQWSEDKPLIQPQNRDILIFALTQVEFFLGTFAVSLYLNQSVHTGYMAALEEQANLRLGKPLFLWESDVARRFIASPESPFFGQSVYWLPFCSLRSVF